MVEDSTEVRRAILQVLEMEHYAVHQAEHGRAALKKLEAITPDLILSDTTTSIGMGAVILSGYLARTSQSRAAC